MELLGLDIHAWITIVLILGMFATLMATKIPADTVFLSVMALLLITGCLNEKAALSGFSSSTVVVVGALFIVVAGLEHTGVLDWVTKHLLGEPTTYSRAIIRLMVPVAVLSSMLSNTTVVALFIKIVKKWAAKLNIAPSKFLIPLSYAAGMGGVCTLIGTPPNLIIAGFCSSMTGTTLGIFSTLLPGLVCLAVGIGTIIALNKLLPVREAPKSDDDDNTQEIKPNYRTLLSSVIMIAMVVVSAFDIAPLLNCCFVAALLMLITRCCSVKQAKKAIDWDVLMIFACSVTIGVAIDNTGLAQKISQGMVGLCGSNALLAFIIICTLGTFLTEFISNTACGAIMAPIAIEIATAMNVNPITFCIGLMISVSSSFATPIGSPTHLMVYTPGGYRFSDFVRIGLPMNFIILATNIIATLIIFPL